MSYQVLARKWRPRDFDGMVGQTHVVRALINALDTDRVHHAFLFAGTRGVGKTTLARILAKCLNCERGVSSKPCGTCSTCAEIDQGRFVDLLEVDAASRAKVDETRDLMDSVQFAPARGRYKVYLIDEVHMFSAHSFNALLKTLEEPPPHVKFLLATTDPQKLPVTVLSRCLQFNLRLLPADQIGAALDHILGEEGVGFEPPGTRLIARAADGSMRDALSLLDQAIAFGAGFVSAENVRSMLGTLDRDRVHDLLNALAEGDGNQLLGAVNEMASLAIEFSTALRELLSTLQRIATVQLVPDATGEYEEDRESLSVLASKMSPEDVQLYYQIGLVGLRDLPLSPDPRGGFEMILLRMLAFRPVTTSPEPVLAHAPSVTPKSSPPTAIKTEPAPPIAAPVTRSSQTPATPPTLLAIAPQAITSASDLSIQSWSRAVGELSVSGLVKELACNTVFSSHENGVLELVLSPGNAHLSRKTLTDQLEKVLCEYLSGPIQLRVVVGDISGQTPADENKLAGEERRVAAVNAIENDPNVVALRDAFDAVIDQNSIRPVDPTPTD